VRPYHVLAHRGAVEDGRHHRPFPFPFGLGSGSAEAGQTSQILLTAQMKCDSIVALPSLDGITYGAGDGLS
jgi:hypothetical protein